MKKISENPLLRLEWTKMIWDIAPHNAFTDITFYNQTYFIAFREADGHVDNQDGKIRILSSLDLIKWKSVAYLQMDGVDLRDPKFSTAPSGELMLSIGGSVYDAEREYKGRKPRVCFSKDGITWGEIHTIDLEGEWIWQIAWYQGTGYGISYRLSDPHDVKKEWEVNLFSTKDGLNYKLHAPIDLKGKPNEATLRFLPGGQMMALIRKEGGDRQGLIGLSSFPYSNWDFTPCGYRLGGPDFRLIDGDRGVFATRFVKELGGDAFEDEVYAGILDSKGFKEKVLLPSGGDCGYPGICLQGNVCYIVYYSSHEGDQSKIFLSKTRVASD